MESLCPADVFHYHRMLIEERNTELRENLNVALSAEALPHDKGESARKLDEILAPGKPKRTPPKRDKVPPRTIGDAANEKAKRYNDLFAPRVKRG